MAEKYTTWLGIVAFDFNPEKDQRTVSGKVVRKFTLNVDGYPDPVQLDLWPDFEGVELKKGDLVAVGGKASTWDRTLENGDTQTRYQMQPYSLNVLSGTVKSAPPGVKQGGGGIPGVKTKTF